jgi:hypothetical protein
MATKITGFALLFLGLAIILWSLYSSYNIFTGATKVPQVFNPSQQTSSAVEDQASDPLGKMIGEQIKGILPQDALSTFLNLASWAMFVGLTILAGIQIANLGIKLIK